MLTNSKGNWERRRSCGVFGYHCKTCGYWVPYGQPLKCKCGEKEPENIIEAKTGDGKMTTKTNGDWVFERSSGYAGYRCQKCAEWVHQGQPLKCKCGEKAAPLSIVDWFNPKDISHLRAYKHLVEKGCWPEGFKPEGMEMPTGWHTSLTAKMATQYVDDMIRRADNYAEIQKHKEEREARIAEDKASRPKADKILELMKEGWVLMGLPHGIPGDFRMRPPPNSDRRLRMLTVHHMSAAKLIRNKQIVVEENSLSSLRRTEYRLA